MYYVDTSVIAAYYCPEQLSEKAEAFLTSHIRPSISSLTELELFSAVSRKVRERNMSKADGDRIIACFLSHLNNDYYNCLSVGDRHYRVARDWIGLFNTALKALDALHVAIASTEGLILATADKGLAKAAATLGVETMLV